jgi:hypothetical protein
MAAVIGESLDPEVQRPTPFSIRSEKLEGLGRTFWAGNLELVLSHALVAVFTMVIVALHLQDDSETCGTAKWNRLPVVARTTGDYFGRRARICINFVLRAAQHRAYE